MAVNVVGKLCRLYQINYNRISPVCLLFCLTNSYHSAAGPRLRHRLALPGQQTVGGLVDAGAVPVGLADHLLAPVCKVLIGERRIDSIRHFRHLQMGKGRRLFAVALVVYTAG